MTKKRPPKILWGAFETMGSGPGYYGPSSDFGFPTKKAALQSGVIINVRAYKLAPRREEPIKNLPKLAAGTPPKTYWVLFDAQGVFAGSHYSSKQEAIADAFGPRFHVFGPRFRKGYTVRAYRRLLRREEPKSRPK